MGEWRGKLVFLEAQAFGGAQSNVIIDYSSSHRYASTRLR